MLKFFFWSLLALNALIFAYGQGMLGSYRASEREPQRLRNQTNTDKLVLQLPAAAGKAAAAPPVPAPVAAPAQVPVAAAPAPGAASCTEVGNFNAAQARRFERLVAPLNLGERQSQLDITISETSSYMVMIPPLGSKEAADRKAAELKEQGVTNYFIMNDTSPAKWAISLGVFKSETAAQTLMAQLKKQNVTGAKIVARTTQAPRQIYRFRDLDAATRAALDEAVGKFDDIATRACGK